MSEVDLETGIIKRAKRKDIIVRKAVIAVLIAGKNVRMRL